MKTKIISYYEDRSYNSRCWKDLLKFQSLLHFLGETNLFKKYKHIFYELLIPYVMKFFCPIFFVLELIFFFAMKKL